jgi:hypothetical protein
MISANNYKKEEDIININYNFIENNQKIQNLQNGISIKKQGSCSIGCDEWSKTFMVFYNNVFTLQFNLIADKNGSYGSIYDYDNYGKITWYKTKDLHNEEEFDKFINILEKNSKILNDNYKQIKDNMHVILLCDKRELWIEKDEQKYEANFSFNGTVHLYKLNPKNNYYESNKDLINHYDNVELMIEKNQNLKKTLFNCCLVS